MSYSVRAADNLMAEQQYEIERQHKEITELSGRLNDALANASGFEQDAEEFGKLADRLSAAITSAISDLRLLTEVPFGQLEDAVKAIADRLADQNGERY